MRLAYITAAERGLTDRILAGTAGHLMARGYRLTGVVQTNIHRPERYHCDMDLRVLPDGPVTSITQNLGAQSRGCRLDPAALEAVTAEISRRIAGSGSGGGPDLLILNKFGKHEAEGRGFRPVIAEALGLGMAVLLGVNALNRDAFLSFAGGLAEELPASVPTLADWAESQLAAAN